MHAYCPIKILISNIDHKVNVLQNTKGPVNNSFQVVVGPIVQGTKPDDRIVLRMYNDQLSMCTALENIKLL